MDIYPKVLIVNQQSVNKNNATGITLRSLWGDWPPDHLLEVYTDNYETHATDKLSIESICIPTNIINELAHGKAAKKVNAEIKQVSIETKQSIKTTFRQAVVLALDLVPIMIPESVESRIRAFQPEIIYTLGATVNTLQLVYRLSSKLDIPVIIHYMDNWSEHLQWESNPLIKPYRRALDKQHIRCLNRCRNGLAISPQMAEEYSKKYGIPFSFIMNSVDVGSFHLEPKRLGESVEFVYAGGLHLDRWKALVDFSRAIIDADINGKLHIYTSRENADLYQACFPDNTEFHEPVDHSSIIEVYRTADILVHTETNNPLLAGFFKYSISTKIPEYLSSGRPVIFFGPKELGLYQYLKTHNAAYVASTYDELCDTLREMKNSSSRSALLTNAKNLAAANHSKVKNQRVLRVAITEAVMQN